MVREELQKVITEYVYYFNYERKTETRDGMTPVKYEEKLAALSEEDFQKYLDAEKKKYQDMKKHSAERMKKKAMELLASCEDVQDDQAGHNGHDEHDESEVGSND